jgi:hypothetical protein
VAGIFADGFDTPHDVAEGEGSMTESAAAATCYKSA